ncbi:hypothetical protein [Halostella pelagica]|uniref:hypothetical protein n=1 Tax=Halostella pelagica TaxID=2583824 RepID=UPI00108152F8|nr:hypothetical protein [Halostella pelagica]
MSAFGTGARLRLLEFVREPTTAALLLVLPPVVVEVYGEAMASFPALPGTTGDPGTTGRIIGALFAAAFLAGLVGLFQAVSARGTDERLHRCGAGRASLLGARVVTMATVAAVAAAVSLAALARTVDVAAPLAAFGALALGALVYGLFGVLVGALLPRQLEGSLVLVFLVDFDNVLASGVLDVGGTVAQVAPLYHPHALFEAAVTEGTVPTHHALGGVAYAAVLLALAFVAYVRVAGGEPA